MNTPVRLGVSPAASTPTGLFSQRFCGFIFPQWNPGLCGLSHSPLVPPSLSPCKCGTTHSISCPLATSPLYPGCLSPPLLLVWMNVSFLTPWLLDFHAVQFSSSSSYFFFLSLLSFFWLFEEAKCISIYPPSWLEVS